MALGGLGVSLAGFAGLVSALDRRPDAHSPVAAWRIRNIVVGGFSITFVGFGTVALYTVTAGDVALTVRLASLGLVAAASRALIFEHRPGPAWPSERGRLGAVAGTVAIILAALGDVLLGSLGYLQILLLVYLLGPTSIFLNTVRDVAARRDRPEDS